MLKELASREGIGRNYVSLDDLNERQMAKADPKLFLQLHEPPVLIDEVQYAPELFTYIKIHVDEHHMPGAFWLTGSQIYRLMRGVQESLAGRVALLHLSPLSQREITVTPPKPLRSISTLCSVRARSLRPSMCGRCTNASGTAACRGLSAGI